MQKSEEASDNMDSSEDSELGASSSSENNNSECGRCVSIKSIEASYSLQRIKDNVNKVFKKTCSLVKLFKKSTLKNITLQKYKFGEDITL